MKKMILTHLCLFIAIMTATVGAAVILAMFVASNTVAGLSFSDMLIPFSYILRVSDIVGSVPSVV